MADDHQKGARTIERAKPFVSGNTVRGAAKSMLQIEHLNARKLAFVPFKSAIKLTSFGWPFSRIIGTVHAARASTDFVCLNHLHD